MGICEHGAPELLKIIHGKQQKPTLSNFRKTEPAARALGDGHRSDESLGVGLGDEWDIKGMGERVLEPECCGQNFVPQRVTTLTTT